MDASLFHTTLIKEFGLESLSPEEQEDYIDQVGELVLQGVLIKSLSALSPEQALQLEAMIDAGKEQEDILHFLQTSIPSFVNLVQDEVAVVKADLAAGMGELD